MARRVLILIMARSMRKALVLPALAALFGCSQVQPDTAPIASAGSVDPASQIATMQQRGQATTTADGQAPVQAAAAKEPEIFEFVLPPDDMKAKRELTRYLDDPDLHLIRRVPRSDGTVLFRFACAPNRVPGKAGQGAPRPQ